MKYFFTFSFFFLLSSIGCFGQTTFPYNHSTAIEILNDTVWIKQNTQKIVDIDSKSSKNQPDILKKLEICVILNKPKEGKKIIKTINDKNIKEGDKAFVAMIYSYFEKIENKVDKNYYKTIPLFFNQLNPSYESISWMAEFSYHIINLGSNDSAIIQDEFTEFVPLNPNKKEFTQSEIDDIIMMSAFRKIAIFIKDEHTQYTTELKISLEKQNKEYLQLWEDREYHFLSSDKPKQIIACNIQIFDKKSYGNQTWVNTKEIANNNIDDDNNGIVDDINGFIYNQNTRKAEGINLNDTSLERYFLKNNNYKVPDRIQHANMSVELMLKDNTFAKMMCIEQADDWWAWRDIKKQYTHNIDHNKKVMFAMLDRIIVNWQLMGKYCNKYNVRVVENNMCPFNSDDDYESLYKNADDSAEIAKKIHQKLATGLANAEKLAPNTLFVFAAGNQGVNNDVKNIMPMCIHTDNNLTVGALHKNLRRASYSNYGKDVEIFAPAHFKLKSQNTYSESSGTSAACPVVCNLAIKLFCLNPKLTPNQVKQLIIANSDKGLYEKDINIINPKETIEAMKKKNYR